MTHGSLFSGIGGFDLAAQWMGWTNVFHVERDPFCQKVLAHHFPESDAHDDIKNFDGTAYAGRIDLVTGGFPCQPFSTAGARRGAADERHLWPEMLRVIREIGPTWIVGENVRGLTSWNDGLLFDSLLADLDNAGYEVFPTILPAAGVNAPHKRERIWVVAYANDDGGRRGSCEVQGAHGEVPQRHDHAQSCDASPADAANADGAGWEKQQFATITEKSNRNNRPSDERNAADTDHKLRQQRNSTGEANGPTEPQNRVKSSRSARNAARNVAYPSSGRRSQDDKQHASEEHQPFGSGWDGFPTVPAICSRDDGLSLGLDGITFPKWRRESIKAYGNAIVPQVALQIFKAIDNVRHL